MSVVSLEAIASLTGSLRRIGSRIVMAHGCFDLLHAGHVRHLQAAAELGNCLVVTVTADAFVDKGPDRPLFSQDLRAELLAALRCVDYVAVNDHPTAVEAIHLIRPHVFVKGVEYTESISEALSLEEAAIIRVGGKMVFLGKPEFHSTDLIRKVMAYG